jgi:hypothetical protein
MKRIGFVLSFLVLAAAPAIATAKPYHISIEAADCSELPWATVDAVLKKVAAQGRYTYASLTGWYDAGQLTVALSSSGAYVVRIVVADGLLDVILIDNL